jgi:hypothetical protein
MLSKVSRDNISFGTDNIKEFSNYNDFDIIQDNSNGLLLVKNKNNIYIWNYKLHKKYNHNRIQIEFNNKYFFKQIDSFDQNNIKQSTNIRKSVLNYFKFVNKSQNIIGIGGEYYIYFPFLKYDNCHGLSNHKSIVEDANYNFPHSSNTLVDYSNFNTLPLFDKTTNYDIIINVVNIHENIIKYICDYNCQNIIIITCKPLNTKIKMLNKYLILKKITHIKNINSLISICLFNKI